VKPTCFDGTTTCWKIKNCTGVPNCPTGDDGYFAQVTARHILAQSSGCTTYQGCFAAPGTAFTYDSEQYISHLSYLLGVTSKQPAVQWATNNVMAKLGLEDFYVDDELGHDFSAGGGQLVSCRDTARLSQLIMNKGLWRSDDGTVERLVGADYIQQMSTPQFPKRAFTYGLLTWLNAKRDPAVSPPCCAPRWGPKSTCSGNVITDSLLGDGMANGALHAPHDVAMAMGWLGQYMFIVPSRNVTIASLGASWGSSTQCPIGNAKPTDPVYNDGYDDAFSATLVWMAMDNATKPAAARKGTATTTHHSNGNGKIQRQEEARHRQSFAAAARHSRGSSGTSAAPPTGGSCTCKCPPGRGFGRCYDMPLGATTCAAVTTKAAADCPAVGIPRQCSWPPVESDWNCSAADNSMRGDVGSITVWGGHLTCRLSKNCSLVDASLGLASATCSCQPAEYGGYACDFSPESCAYSPYFPPGS